MVTRHGSSLEGALQDLASALTGTPAAALPHSLEDIVQFMADNVKLPEATDPESLTEPVAAAVAEKLKADDSFITALAAKVAEKGAGAG